MARQSSLPTRFLLASLLLASFACAHAQDQPAKSPAAPEAREDAQPPLPADASIAQTVNVGGKTLRYSVTVGTIPIYGRTDPAKPETKTAEVVYTSYVAEGANRPVTFAMNGGPGASSVYLNFGAIGPKHIQFGQQGDSPSDPPTLTDNPGTWLPFTDLVFIDPVGTGFSRSLVSEADTKKLFYSTTPDIEYLSRVIYDWLVKNGRLDARKYLVGESYGGYRGPRVTHYLQSTLGVAMNGVVLVSPYLNPGIGGNPDLSPIPWIVSLPSIAAAHLENEHQLTPERMADVIAYARGEYATDLLKGRSDPQATPRIVKSVTELSGLDPAFVKYSGGRIETGAYLREIHRERGEIGSIYDSNVTEFDPFPFAPEQRSNDPLLESIIAPTTSAMVTFITRTVGWKTTARYHALSYEVNRAWDGGGLGAQQQPSAVPDLRESVAADPKLHVLIAHGWNDLSCPFMGSVLTVDEMPLFGDPARVSVHEYPGGHMFYTRPDSQAAFLRDVEAMFAAH